MTTDVQEAKPEEPKKATLKSLKGYQTNCDEKDAKGKPCWGTLKTWYTAPDEIRAQVPPGDSIYRCQNCWQIYHGSLHHHLAQSKRSASSS